jgi:hypothetical protein
VAIGSRQTLSGGERVTFWVADATAETEAFFKSRPEGPLGELGQTVLYARILSSVSQWMPYSRQIARLLAHNPHRGAAKSAPFSDRPPIPARRYAFCPPFTSIP